MKNDKSNKTKEEIEMEAIDLNTLLIGITLDKRGWENPIYFKENKDG